MRAAAGGLLVLHAALGAADTPPKGNRMATTAEAAAMLQKRGDRLFEGDGRLYTDIELATARTDFRGLAIAAPAQVQADAKPAVPVVLLTQQTVLRTWEVPDQYNLMLAVTELDSGTVRARRALVDPKDEEPAGAARPPRPPRPNAAAAAGVSTKVRKLEVPVPPGQGGGLAVAVISFDMVSNTARVALAGPNVRAPGAPRAISPRPEAGQGLPSYAPTPRTPKAPANGVAFAVEPSGGPANAPVVVQGAFAKVAAPQDMLAQPANVRDNGVDRQAGAVVPLTIAVLGLEWNAPRLYPLAVPVYGSARIAPGQNLTGQFATGIAQLPPGQYVAYVFMDGVPYGPQPIQVR